MVFPCPYCLHCFKTEALKQKHMPECGKHDLQTLKYPTDGNDTLQFSNAQNEFPTPFVVYSDLECFLEKTEVNVGKSTKIIQNHKPSGFCCLTVSTFDEYNRELPFVYSGENVMDKFFDHLKVEQQRITQILKKNEKMKPLTKAQRDAFNSCEKCPSCNVNLRLQMLKRRAEL